jgi:L-amino acid N-acyltransferase YncA
MQTPSWEEWDAARLPHSRLVAREEWVLGWAALSPVSKRACYAGVAEVGVYVAAVARGRGVGRALLDAIIQLSESHGIWTLQGATIAENAASLALQATCGFRVVGRCERIGKLSGLWRDTILTERRSTKAGIDWSYCSARTTISIGAMTVENIAPVADLSVTVSSSEAQRILT